MEEVTNIEPVGFPPAPSERQNSKGLKLGIIVVLLVIVIGLVTFLVFKSSGTETNEEAIETPFEETLTPAPTISATATPSAKPVSKDTISVEILNGTGTPGDAAYLQNQLKAMGFKTITTGNADTSDATTTTATFAANISQSLIDEVQTKLESLYKTVEIKTSRSFTDSKFQVITGTKKTTTTATTKPSASPSSTPKPTATP